MIAFANDTTTATITYFAMRPSWPRACARLYVLLYVTEDVAGEMMQPHLDRYYFSINAMTAQTAQR